MLLTKSTIPIIGPISSLFGIILDGIFNGIDAVFHVQNLALTIIIFTIFTRLLLLPLAIRQQKSMHSMQVIQPELKKIQDKYKNKKDQESQRKMQVELSELYKTHNVSPLGGCLTTLIQLPIIFALFGVIRNIPAYIHTVKDLYLGIVTQITSVEEFEPLLETVAESATVGINSFDSDSIITFLASFGSEQWEVLLTQFNQVGPQIQEYLNGINHLNSFFGIDLAQAPGLGFPGIIIPILAVLTQVLASRTMSMGGSTADKTTQQTQKTMMYFMPIISGFFVITMPAGLGLYWITSNLFQFLQQIYIHRRLNKEKEVK